MAIAVKDFAKRIREATDAKRGTSGDGSTSVAGAGTGAPATTEEGITTDSSTVTPIKAEDKDRPASIFRELLPVKKEEQDTGATKDTLSSHYGAS